MELTRERKHWTPSEDKDLTTMVNQGWTDDEIAPTMQRTVKAIVHRRCFLGLQKRSEFNWTQTEEIAALEKKTLPNRSAAAVKCKRHRLRKAKNG